jgi:hypothetical protein
VPKSHTVLLSVLDKDKSLAPKAKQLALQTSRVQTADKAGQAVLALRMAAAEAEESSRRRRRRAEELCAAAVSVADAASWWCAVALVALVLLGALRAETTTAGDVAGRQFRGPRLGGPAARPCEEVYVVGEGETLHSISDKCGDPFIVERNPHIHDPDDVFPGLVIALCPTKNT